MWGMTRFSKENLRKPDAQVDLNVNPSQQMRMSLLYNVFQLSGFDASVILKKLRSSGHLRCEQVHTSVEGVYDDRILLTETPIINERAFGYDPDKKRSVFKAMIM